MDQIKIKVNNNSLYINNSNNILGEIYLEKNGYIYFPEEKWTDFVVIILSWWMKKLRSIKHVKCGENIEVDFMNGPLMLIIEKINDNEVNLTGIKRNLISADVLFEAKTHLDDLMRGLVAASNSVVHYAKSKHWETKELIELEKELKFLLH
jgi:uncharacterized protein YkvS